VIKLNNINKYFNKGKNNEIHVINNTTLKFPEKGLISLLGESGSGKTTLLNVIGGLDKAFGTINFNGEELKVYKDKKWDSIRVNNIGYIFQNYYLLEDRTVLDNIHIVLHMMGITNKDEVKYRTEYVLNSVGMYRFRNKLASDLSGGQKQRVAIARAIVKNPDVIIADEPTGNLDTNNSIEVLKIIKEISKEKLVILVTHNIDLANNYSDRIIKIKDGTVISDNLNESSSNNIEYIDKNIYLNDLNSFKNENVEFYSNEELDNIDLKLVKINNNYYLKTSEKNVTVNLLNDNGDIKLIKASKSDIKDDFTKETSFSLNELEKEKSKRGKTNVYTFKDSLIQAFRKLTNLGRKGKLQIIALIYLGVMFTTAFLMLMSSVTIDYKSVNFDDDVYEFNQEAFKKSNSNENNIPNNAILSTKNIDAVFYNGSFSVTIYGSTLLPKEIIGKENTNKNEIFIDSSVLNKSYVNKIIFDSFGITKKEHLINQKVRIAYYDLFIKDTVNTNTKNIYVDKEILLDLLISDTFYNFIYDFNINLFSNDYIESNKTLDPNIKQNLKGNEYDIYISDQINDDLEMYIEDLNLSGFKVVGFYEDNNKDYKILIKEETFLEKINQKPLDSTFRNYILYIKDNDNLNPDVYLNIRESIIDNMKNERNIIRASSIAQTGIAIGLSLLIFYFLVRSNLTSRRKEISILRSLGISKNEVRRLFMTEYAILTTFTSLIGVFIGVVIANYVSGSFLSDFFNLRTSSLSIILAIILVYLINVFVSLIPVNLMLRKTPAELLTNYDI